MTENFEAVQSKESKSGDSQISGSQGESLSDQNAYRELLKDFQPNTIGGISGTNVPENEQHSLPKNLDDLPKITIEKGKDVDKKHDGQEQDKTIFSPEEGIDINKKQQDSLEDFSTKIPDGTFTDIDKVFKQNREIDKEDREEAKETLADETSDLIPAKDREKLKTMQTALIDGDLKAFSKVVKDASSDPEKLGLLVKELNKQLNENEKMGGVELKVHNGNVLMYEENGDTALKIDSKSGEASIHPIKTQADGSVVMTPGEIINKEPSDVMKSIGDESTRSLTRHNVYFLKELHNNIGNEKIMEQFNPTIGPKENFQEHSVRPYFENPGVPGKTMEQDSFIEGFKDGVGNITKGVDQLLNK